MTQSLGLIATFCLLAAATLSPPVASQNSIGTQISATSTSSLIRLKSTRIRRPESCRESLPRKSEDLPVLVITGRVKEVYPAPDGPGVSQQLQQRQLDTKTNRALVTVLRVIKGNKQLVNSDILVAGFNSSSSQPCPNFVKTNDSLILLLNQDADRRYSIQGNNILSMNLNNLDRINAIAADEPFKRRNNIEDILCEAHYCPYGRCVASDRGQLTCHCPDSCPPLPSPVCGSDNTTYTSECHLIKEGCKRQRPLFVTKESTC